MTLTLTPTLTLTVTLINTNNNIRTTTSVDVTNINTNKKQILVLTHMPKANMKTTAPKEAIPRLKLLNASPSTKIEIKKILRLR